MNLPDYESLIQSAVSDLRKKYHEEVTEEKITEASLILFYTHPKIELFLSKKLKTRSFVKMVDTIASDIAWILLA